jgi:hypothetical protein
MIAWWVVVILLFGHWIFDFVLQPHWMSLRKSKEWFVLVQHATIITIGVLLAAVFTLSEWKLGRTERLIPFAVINGAGHFSIDAVTSRITSRLYAKQDFHNFFVIIGLDQWLHTSMLVVTWWALFR